MRVRCDVRQRVRFGICRPPARRRQLGGARVAGSALGRRLQESSLRGARERTARRPKQRRPGATGRLLKAAAAAGAGLSAVASRQAGARSATAGKRTRSSCE